MLDFEAMRVLFEFDWGRTLGAISYLASKRLPDLTKYKICKLLFLADKQHLVRYGRPITGDTYFALEWGPVPSNTLDALNDDHPLAMAIKEVLSKSGSGKYPRYSLKRGSKGFQEALSESDLKTLDTIVERYGHRTFDQLYEITHEAPAYAKAWARRQGNRSLMEFEDFFEGDPDAIKGVREELLESVEILEGVSTEIRRIRSFDPRTVFGDRAGVSTKLRIVRSGGAHS